MLPMIQEQVALRWGDLIPAESLINFVAISESTPGPFAINMATYVGSVVGAQNNLAVLGSFCATLGVVLPSFIVILIVAKCYDAFRNSRVVKGCMSGLKPAVVGLIGGAIFSVFVTVFFPAGFTWAVFSQTGFYVSAAIFGLMLVLVFKKVHPILLICLSAGIGVAAGYLGLL
jgi:chromate transporter